MTTDLSVGRAAFLLLAIALLPAATTVAAPLRYETTAAAAGRATLEIQADSLVTMTPLPFRLLISDPSGQPVRGARVDCELVMPSMRMPENRPQVTERDGAYVGEMILTCVMGDYRAACTVEETGGTRRALTFDLGRARLR